MLTVKIHSFSFKKSGIPEDKTSNGGGFVFDCRFIENPGRKKEFRSLNGMDSEVLEFLDKNEDMQKLIESAVILVTAAVQNYLSRDFTDLMVSFGCTGGQHRSVYASERLAARIRDAYRDSVIVVTRHIDLPLK